MPSGHKVEAEVRGPPADNRDQAQHVLRFVADVEDILASREASVEEDGELVPVETVLDMLKATGKAAATRFMIVAGEDMRPKLYWQCLPATASALAGKPCFHG